MLNNNDLLLKKLNGFIRKYYKNILIKGVFYSIALLVLFFLLFVLIEFVGYNSIVVRTIIFYVYSAFSVFLLIRYVVFPLTKLLNIGKTITYEEAAQIIGAHFPEVSDKLLNLLQLKQMSLTEESEILLASIDQKTKELYPITFHKAIDKKKTKKIGVASLIIVMVLFLTAIIFPDFLKDSTYRYIKYDQYFEKPAPFEFILLNSPLEILQQQDVVVNLKVKGNVLPDVVNIKVNENEFQMKKNSKTTFSYKISQLQKNTFISFNANGYASKRYLIKVNPKPIIVNIKARLIPPTYTKLGQTILTSLNDICVPKGSKLVLEGLVRDTKDIIIIKENKESILIPNKKGEFSFSQIMMNDEEFDIKTQNQFTNYSDTLKVQIKVIEDLYPQIAVVEYKDSIFPDRILFKGQIKDDYGFAQLKFCLHQIRERDTIFTFDLIEVSKQENAQDFYYDLLQLTLKQGDKLEYYFEVKDNDAINGGKITRSNVFSFDLPTEEELELKKEKNSENIKNTTQEVLSSIKELKDKINELSRKVINKQDLSWQDKEEIKELIKQQEEIKQSIEEIKQSIEENNTLEEKLSEQEEEILNKQRELEELFERVLDEQMKEILEEIKKLSEENIDKNKLNESLNNIKLNNENLSKELDKNIEIYKRLEVEKLTNELTEKLDELAREQKSLSEEINSKKKENISPKQKNISKEYLEQKAKLDKIEKLSQEIDDYKPINRNKQLEESIEKNQKEASERLEQNKNKKASESMNSAAEQMQQMSNEIKQQSQENQSNELGEDIEQVRQILKSLVHISKEQEDLMNKIKITKVSDPSYQEVIKKQYHLKEKMKPISDTLFNMSKRQPQIGSIINQELSKIENNIEQSIESLLQYNQVHYSNYKNNSVLSWQQYAMSSMNNLALMLRESLENMKNQQQNSNSKSNSKQQCNNPSTSQQQNKSSQQQSLKDLQESLNRELERLRKELEQGQQQGKKKIGENSKLNESLAKAAAQQEMIRKLLQKEAEKIKAEQGKPSKLLNEISKQMEQTEKEIVNKKISRTTINRQAKILTRLLEHEKAEKKQGKDEKRESRIGKDKKNREIKEFLEFKELKKKEIEIFKQIQPMYTPFYKEKVNKYFYDIENKTQKK
ncbi:MAG: hypothetical protein IKV46_02610 [Bacteroidales bacterium]|nr:hypothetical protein [Bacteroidales bacterium]